jgi:hypothetical protein
VRYRFSSAEKARYPLGLLCRVMRVSQSAYHAYQSGKSYVVSAEPAALSERVKAIFYRHQRCSRRAEDLGGVESRGC